MTGCRGGHQVQQMVPRSSRGSPGPAEGPQPYLVAEKSPQAWSPAEHRTSLLFHPWVTKDRTVSLHRYSFYKVGSLHTYLGSRYRLTGQNPVFPVQYRVRQYREQSTTKGRQVVGERTGRRRPLSTRSCQSDT